MNTMAWSFTSNHSWSKQEIAEPKPLQVLIEVVAFGINQLDLDRMKNYPDKIPGLEVSGIVKAIGSEVTRFNINDQVMALLPDGGYSTHVLADESLCLPVKNMPLTHAAALPEALFTAWFNLFQLAHAKKGESLLVQGASGGIGVHTALLAQALGLNVIVSTRSEEKKHALKALGLSVCDERVCHENSMDIVWDILGPQKYYDYFKWLKVGGRIAMVDALLGDEACINVDAVFSKQLSITGSLLQPQPPAMKTKICSKLEKNVLPLIDKKTFFPVIGEIFTGYNNLDKAIETYRHKTRVGKIILAL